MWRRVVRNEVLLYILLGVVLLRIPTLFEPYWYGDEGIYLTIGHALRQGVELYSGIHDNKPPFLYLIAALADGYQFWFRFITLAWVVATVAIFGKLALRFAQGKQKVVVWTTAIFAVLTSIPLLEGNIANAELYFLLFTVGAFYWLYRGRSAFVGGLLLGLGALFKIPAILEVGVWPIFWLLTAHNGWFKKSIMVGLGAILPMAISLVYFAWRGTLSSYLVATGIQNIPYLSSWQAPLSMLWRVIIAAGIVVILAIWRKSWDQQGLLVGLWWTVTLFASLLSGRPYPHYLLQMTPAVALGIAILVWGKERERYMTTGLIMVLVSAVVMFRFYAYPVVSYYSNFLSWIAGQRTKEAYFAAFSSDVQHNYQIAQIITAGSMPNEPIFVWGDQPMIYALSRHLPVGKYTAKYHILEFQAQKETLLALQKNPPRYIVSFGQEQQLPGLANLLRQRYVPVGGEEGLVYRIINP